MDESCARAYCQQPNRNALNSKIEFYRHHIGQKEKQELLRVLDSIFLTTGDVTKNFEQKFAEYLQTKHAVGVMSCTHALELCLRYFDIEAGDEVVTTPLSFVATANAIECVGARPIFVDVEESTGNIDAGLIEQAITLKTKAILPVHLYGHMCDMRRVREIADQYNLKIIEDAAHCIEGVRDGVRPGQLADAACFSFYATKSITCGEGGAVTTNDSQMYEWLLMARQHGISKSAVDRYSKKYMHYDLELLGMKCNMSDIQAALLLNQLDHIDEQLQKRHEIVDKFDAGIKCNRPLTLDSTQHARHLYTIWVNSSKRDELLESLYEEGIGVAVNYLPIHLMKYYQKKYGFEVGTFPNAEQIGACTISLPFYPLLKENEIDFVADVVNRYVTQGY